MSDYIYTRDLVNGAYDINNVARVDGEGDQIYLYQEIKAEGSLPNAVEVNCAATVCTISFEVPLDGAQQTTLDTIVTAHKNNT